MNNDDLDSTMRCAYKITWSLDTYLNCAVESDIQISKAALTRDIGKTRLKWRMHVCSLVL